jgi:hypothetical protein
LSTPRCTHPTDSEQAFIPVLILLISFVMRIQEPSRRLLVIVLTISFGVSLASYSELHFNAMGTYILAIEFTHVV